MNGQEVGAAGHCHDAFLNAETALAGRGRQAAGLGVAARAAAIPADAALGVFVRRFLLPFTVAHHATAHLVEFGLAFEDGVGGDDCADCLRYLVTTKSRMVVERKLRGL